MKKILIIDDSAIILEKMKKFFHERGYGVEAAPDGAQGLKKIAGQDFDLVLLDVEMPGMDGFETCRRLRSEEKNKLLPQVVFFTSHEEPAKKVEGLQLGVSDFIVKSLAWEMPDEFLARIEAHLRISGLLREKVEIEKLRILHAAAVSVNHEIANPLQCVVFAVERIKSLEGENTRMKKYFDAIDSNIERMAAILQDLTNAAQAATTGCAGGGEMIDIIKSKEKGS